MARSAGFSLIELLTALAIGALLCGTALPAYHNLVTQNQTSAALNELFGALQLARQTATFDRVTTTICPWDGATCGNDWRAGYAVFLDRNGNGVIDANDRVLAQGSATPAGAKLTWRSFRLRPFLSFTGRGLTRAENGSFVYCGPNGSTHSAAKIVLNTAGRARHVGDRDHDGRFDDGSGAAVCP